VLALDYFSMKEFARFLKRLFPGNRFEKSTLYLSRLK